METIFRLNRTLPKAPPSQGMAGTLVYPDTTSSGATRTCLTMEDGLILARTVEDTWNAAGQPVQYVVQEKQPGKTAIPAGRYRIATTWSVRFQKKLPEIRNVPGFTGIRIHAGNGPEDTEGCILVGQQLNKRGWRLVGSKNALARVLPAIDYWERRGPVFLEVINP
jgi:hypothetical protein